MWWCHESSIVPEQQQSLFECPTLDNFQPTTPFQDHRRNPGSTESTRMSDMVHKFEHYSCSRFGMRKTDGWPKMFEVNDVVQTLMYNVKVA